MVSWIGGVEIRAERQLCSSPAFHSQPPPELQFALIFYGG